MKLDRLTLGSAALAIVLVAVLPLLAQDRTVERAFSSGGTVRLDLSAGEYRITGSPDNRVRVRWEIRSSDDPDDVQVRADVKGTIATIRTRGPRNGFHVEIELPRRSDVVLELSAGDLRIVGIDGSKDISATAGEVTIEVGDTARYRNVDASVRIGELNAAAFHVEKGGFFSSFHWSGKGEYKLRASLTVGELNLTR